MFMRSVAFGFFLLVSAAFFCLHAQPITEPESPSRRIDPEWVQVNNSQEFCWAYDIIADKQGNTYSAGYFRIALGYEGKSLQGNCPHQYACGDMMFVIKRDAGGKAIWVRYASGRHSRPAELSFDKEGKLVLVGTMYGDSLHFFNESFPTGVSLAGGINGGIFLCRFHNTDGNILNTRYISAGKDEEAHSIAFDEQRNTYVGGVRHFRTKANPSLQQRAYLIRKLDAEWNTVWEQAGDTTGNSMITSVAFQGNALYATGSFQEGLRIGKKRWSSRPNEYAPFVLSMTKRGKLNWLNDSLNTYRMGAVGSMAVDEAGNAFLWIGSSYSFSTLARVDSKGKLVWSHTILGNTTIYAEKILIGDNDKLYLCGQTYANTFTGRDSQTFFMQSKGSVDGYIACYSTSGNLEWLKAMGGRGTDWCNGIAVNKDRLYAFGFTDLPMVFYKDTAETGNGRHFWTASFLLGRLQDSNANVNDPLPVPEVWPKIDSSACACQQKKPKIPGFMPMLNHHATLGEVMKASRWWQSEGDSSFGYLFYTDYYHNGGWSGESGMSMNVISFEPVVWHAPDTAFSVELFTCVTENRMRQQQIYFSGNHAILRYEPGFDINTFDSSAQTYLHLFLSVYGGNDEDIIDQLTRSEYNEDGALPYFQRYNEKYGLNLVFDPEEEENWSENFLDALREKDISLEDFLLTEYIQPAGKKTHTITAKEKDNLESLMAYVSSGFYFDRFNQYLHPEYRVLFPDAYIRLLFDPKVVRMKDPANTQKTTGLSILVASEELDWNTYRGMELTPSFLCIPKAEVGKTGVMVQIDTLRLHATMNREDDLHPSEYAVLGLYGGWLDTTWREVSYRYRSASSLIPFSGITSGRSHFEVPFDGQMVAAFSNQLALNNKLITGTLYLAIDTSLSPPHNGKYPLKGLSPKELYDEKDLEQHFLKLGFTRVRVIKGHDDFEVEFLYVKK